MRHKKTKHKLSRDSAHRKSLLMNLSKELIEHERIKTNRLHISLNARSRA